MEEYSRERIRRTDYFQDNTFEMLLFSGYFKVVEHRIIDFGILVHVNKRTYVVNF